MEKYSCIIPVAGLSTRMGSFKPILSINGIPMIAHTVETVVQAGIKTIIIVIGYRADQVKRALQGFDNINIIYIENKNFQNNDMLDSIKLGMEYLIDKPFDVSFILPGDMPKINPRTFWLVADDMTKKDSIVAFPSLNNKRKHPPLISKECFKFIISFNGDGGLRNALETFETQTSTIEIQNIGYPYDADTYTEYIRLLES